MSKHEKTEAKKASSAAAMDQLGIKKEAVEMEKLLEHPSYIELQTKLTEAEEKANQNWDIALRTKAEMENINRRVSRDVENAHKYALEKFVGELLPVVDNLERALTHAKDEGVELTLQSLIAAMAKFGVEQVNPLDKPFDPAFHQAVATEVNPDLAANTVMNVLQKGYILNNRLVRPALVVVSKID